MSYTWPFHIYNKNIDLIYQNVAPPPPPYNFIWNNPLVLLIFIIFIHLKL